MGIPIAYRALQRKPLQNKKQKKGFKNIDDDLRGKRQYLHRKINFIPAKRLENSMVLDSSLSGPVVAKQSKESKITRQLQGDQFEEPEHYLYPKIRLLRVLNWKHVSKIGPGLLNVGNTCFCNAVLQCLTYTPPLANLCKAEEHSKRVTVYWSLDGKFDALREVERHIISSSRCSQGVLKPSNIVNSFRKIGARLRLGRQEDAHEFTRLLMEAMHLADLAACRFTESPYSRAAQTGDSGGSARRGGEAVAGLVHGIFGGHLRSQVRCETCRYNSNTYDAFLGEDSPDEMSPNLTGGQIFLLKSRKLTTLKTRCVCLQNQKYLMEATSESVCLHPPADVSPGTSARTAATRQERASDFLFTG
eukprot:163893-Hanusia_phi.AAC.1